jgi:hypothetical protein
MAMSFQFKFATVSDMLEYVSEPGILVTTLEVFNAIEDLGGILVDCTALFLLHHGQGRLSWCG